MIRVLVVDDSVVFRSQISSGLHGAPGVEVIGSAANGKIALQKLEQMEVDVVTLDMEMPEMGGLETLKEIRSRKIPVKVIVFSSQTMKGAEKALEALAQGADDVVAKPSGEMNLESSQAAIASLLLPKVLQFVDPMLLKRKEEKTRATPGPNHDWKVRRLKAPEPRLVVVASSTGGPSALEELFKPIKQNLRPPLLIVQHMPPIFTEILAKRLSTLSGLKIEEAKDGEHLEAGMIRICPGDYHLRIRKREEGGFVLKLSQEAARNSVRPAADYLFESAAECFGSQCLGVVLTGMGEDGKVGSHAIRAFGGAVVIQEESSCTVFGMPRAVFESNQFDEVVSLERLSNILNQWKS